MIFKTDNLTGRNLEAALLLNKVNESKSSFLKSLSNETDTSFSHATHCLMKLEAVKLDEPVYLFGSRIKTASVNKLSIYQAVINKQNPSEKEAGKLLFETLITDDALAKLAFSNSGNPVHMTFHNVSRFGTKMARKKGACGHIESFVKVLKSQRMNK